MNPSVDHIELCINTVGIRTIVLSIVLKSKSGYFPLLAVNCFSG